jgi:hypothetical protein
MIISSLTQFKKNIKVGDVVETTFHIRSKGHSTETGKNEYQDVQRPPRRVVDCNTTGFSLATFRNGKWEQRRIKYPKASNCYIESGKLIIMGDDLDNPYNTDPVKWLTIQVVES